MVNTVTLSWWWFILTLKVKVPEHYVKPQEGHWQKGKIDTQARPAAGQGDEGR